MTSISPLICLDNPRNTALILISRNAGDLLNEQVTNCLSSVFAFRSSERAEVANVLSLLGVELSEDHKAALRSLSNGECIFRDLNDRASALAGGKGTLYDYGVAVRTGAPTACSAPTGPRSSAMTSPT